MVAALQIALQGVDNASVRTRMLLGRLLWCVVASFVSGLTPRTSAVPLQ